MSALERATADVAAGRLWKARDRLAGALAHHPHDADLLDALAEVYLRMGDVPAAGRFLMLSARDDEAARAARDEFRWLQRSSPAALAASIPARQPLEDYPAAVRERLDELATAARSEGSLPRWLRGPGIAPADAADTGDGSWLLPLAIAAFIAIPWVIGLVVAVITLIGWIT